ncbi:hypothetical protein FOA52_002559 [Chlamydomonas sp. UWO 241]|nr:hypothetical protein FOA52_002559 [Chlamydomonas sp. UWO 241]
MPTGGWRAPARTKKDEREKRRARACLLILSVAVAAILLCAPKLSSAASASSGPRAWAEQHPEFGHRSAIPRTLLDRARAVLGDEARVHAFVAKLLAGEPTKFAVLGSSLASCRGASHLDSGWPALLHKWLELAFTPCAAALPRGTRFFTPSPGYWYQLQRHLCEQSTVQYIDMAVYASTPLFAEMCMVPKVPPDVDLVIVEYGVNDMEYAGVAMSSAMAQRLMHTVERRSLERTVRSLLSGPSAPAVLFMEMYSWGMASRAERNFALLPEDFHAAMARYYGNVQVLSSRLVLHPLLTGGTGAWAGGLTPEDIAASGLYQPDGIHPTDAGHRVYADILIAYIQGIAHKQLLAAASEQHAREGGGSTTSGGDTQHPGKHASSAHGAHGVGDADAGDVLLEGGKLSGMVEGLAAAMLTLPPPLAPGNEHKGFNQCFLNHDTKLLVTANAGFEFVDEGGPMDNGLVRHKFGFVAWSPGASLTLRLDTTLGGAATDTVHVLISHLKSYSGMGRARVACVGGCLCAPIDVDAHYGLANVSLTSFADVRVGAHPACDLQVTVLNEPGPDGGFKFKVIGVVLHDSPHAASIPLLAGDHVDYVESKVSGFMPGGFGEGTALVAVGAAGGSSATAAQ